jgi:hypothetical protein
VHDDRGIYYYPVLTNKKLRMYVKLLEDDIAFRLWDEEHPATWEEHGWIPWNAIVQAAEMYSKEKRDNAPPLHLYDMDIAIRLLKDAVREMPDDE